VFEVLDSKIVRTDQGSFINVDDLREFHKQVHEARKEQAQRPKPKTFAEARGMAMRDPAVQAAHQPAPRAPALSSVKGVSTEEERNEAS
jgi:hypothetical protein